MIGYRVSQVAKVKWECIRTWNTKGGVHNGHYARIAQGFRRPPIFDQNVRVGRRATINPPAHKAQVGNEHNGIIDFLKDRISDRR